MLMPNYFNTKTQLGVQAFSFWNSCKMTLGYCFSRETAFTEKDTNKLLKQNVKKKQSLNLLKADSAASKVLMATFALLIVAGLVYGIIVKASNAPAASTTTISLAYALNSCTTISHPGNYSLMENISSPGNLSVCMNIKSGGVSLLGHGHSITGNALSGIQDVISYGIKIGSQSNVSISQLTLSRFSYGIYLNK